MYKLVKINRSVKQCRECGADVLNYRRMSTFYNYLAPELQVEYVPGAWTESPVKDFGLLVFDTIEAAEKFTFGGPPYELWRVDVEDVKPIKYVVAVQQCGRMTKAKVSTWSIESNHGQRMSYGSQYAPQGTYSAMRVKLLERVTTDRWADAAIPKETQKEAQK